MGMSDQHRQPDLREQFLAALQHHRAERLAAAEQLYQRVLIDQPRQTDTLHLLGMLAYQTGRLERALRLVGAAISCDQAVPAFHVTLGNTARALGRHWLAEGSFRRALSLRADLAEAQDALGLLLAARGQTAEAAARFHLAVICAPNSAEYYNNFGLAQGGLNNNTAAAACFRRAGKIRPEFAELHNNLGLLLAKGSGPHFRRAIACAPGLAEAYGNLGARLGVQGHRLDGLASLRRARILRPDNAGCWYAIANSLQDGPPPATLAACHGALICQPDYGAAHNLIGLMLVRLGDLAGAERSYRRALICQPDAAFFHNLAALQKFNHGDGELAAMEQLAEQALAPDDDAQIALRFALGKAYDDCGDAERAFRHYQNANEGQRRKLDYDEAAMLAMMQRASRAFSREMIARRRGAGNPSNLPIFILGMPRSGSTLIEQILASHAAVHGGDERKDFPALLDRIGYPEPAAALTADGFRALGAAYVERVRALAPLAARITDKLPDNFLYAGAIHLALPQALIIHSRRHPVDTCLSCFTKLFRDGQQAQTYDLGELGRYYQGYQRLMEHWRAVLPASIFLEVDYEALVNDPTAQTRRILDHCGLEWDPACLDFHKTRREVRTASAAQVRRPIYTDSIGRWRRFGALLDPLLRELEEK